MHKFESKERTWKHKYSTMSLVVIIIACHTLKCDELVLLYLESSSVVFPAFFGSEEHYTFLLTMISVCIPFRASVSVSYKNAREVTDLFLSPSLYCFWWVKGSEHYFCLSCNRQMMMNVFWWWIDSGLDSSIPVSIFSSSFPSGTQTLYVINTCCPFLSVWKRFSSFSSLPSFFSVLLFYWHPLFLVTFRIENWW
jgi:hypothetical protein